METSIEESSYPQLILIIRRKTIAVANIHKALTMC